MEKEKSENVQGVDNYLEERLQKQQKWYQSKATVNKKRFMRFQTIIIILGALIPLIVVFFPMSTVMEKWTGPVSAAISAIIAVLAGIDKLTQPQTNWFNFRSNEEMLKKEEWMYRYLAGPYSGLSADAAEKQLVERVESVISADIARFAQAEYKKEDSTALKNENPNNQT
jgi:hypothetical protein